MIRTFNIYAPIFSLAVLSFLPFGLYADDSPGVEKHNLGNGCVQFRPAPNFLRDRLAVIVHASTFTLLLVCIYRNRERSFGKMFRVFQGTQVYFIILIICCVNVPRQRILLVATLRSSYKELATLLRSDGNVMVCVVLTSNVEIDFSRLFF